MSAVDPIRARQLVAEIEAAEKELSAVMPAQLRLVCDQPCCGRMMIPDVSEDGVFSMDVMTVRASEPEGESKRVTLSSTPELYGRQR